jgi:2-phosphosulfolactate phosphatase
MTSKRQIEVCFSPALLGALGSEGKIVVMVDIFRASSSICAAFENGVEYLIPVAGLDEARALKEKGFLVAAERNGVKIDFADFGNSPFNFLREEVQGKPIVYSTTNGTRAIHLAGDAASLVVGAFVNHSALVKWILAQNEDVLVLCAGWKDRFSLEDSVYAGALADALLASEAFSSDSDAVTAAIELWRSMENNPLLHKEQFAHFHRLQRYLLADAVDYCLSFDKTSLVPICNNGKIRAVKMN